MRLKMAEKRAVLELPRAARDPAERVFMALEGGGRADLLYLLQTLRRDRQRYESDHTTDPERRILVGPRLPRRMVDRYRVAATKKGQSLYRWATEALEEHLAAQTLGEGGPGQEAGLLTGVTFGGTGGNQDGAE